ncbi:acyl carrier protein [Streptomyces sp. KMM 9044]|uniref:acyl carrier protein n=1 Tax=Streptomyces sp. KMM 9044 TaxID=2744474 RepID=UPI003FA7A3A8
MPSGTTVVLRELLARSLGIPASGVDDDTPFLRLGLDSLGAVGLVKRLERELVRQLPTTLFFEHRTVRELSALLDLGAGAGSRLEDVPGHEPEDGRGPAVRTDGPSPCPPYNWRCTPAADCIRTSRRGGTCD